MADMLEAVPSIIVEDEHTQVIADRLQYIDEQIHTEPELFLLFLESMGSFAVEQSISRADLGKPVAERHENENPGDLIVEYFRNRYDSASYYDDATENAIARDARHRQLLAAQQSKKSYVITTGKVSTAIHSAEGAAPVRDQVRLSRFRLYLNRVVSYKQQASSSEAATPLPSEI